MNKLLAKLIEGGIPVKKAEFNLAVNNIDNVPETHFSEDSQNSSRRAEMYWTQAGLICGQKSKWFVVPTGSVKYAHFKC